MVLFFENIRNDLIAILVVVISISYYLIQKSLNYWNKRGIVTAPSSYPFGTFTPIVLQKVTSGVHFANLYNQFHNDHKVVGTFNGMRPSVLVCDPEIVRLMFTQEFQHFHDRGAYIDEERNPLSGHLFALCGEKWHNLRGKLTPTFTSGKLKAMFSTIVDCGEPLEKYMNEKASNKEVLEMREVLAQYMTNVIASVAFGIEVNCIGNPNEYFRRIGRMYFEPTLKNGLRKIMAFLLPSLLSLFNAKSISQEIEDFVIKVVKENMEYREKNNVSRKDFFQLLVQLRNGGNIQADGLWETKIIENESSKQLSLNEVAAQAFIFFVAGFETSSTTMSFALFEFAKNLDIQEKAQKDVDEILAKHNGEISYDSISEMNYLEWCIDETLRKYPPAPILNRQCTKQWQVPGSDLILERGTEVIVPVLGFQRDPKYYPEPEKFIPERFSPAMFSKSYSTMPYLPFGDGPRTCIGMRMGKMQAKAGLVLLLKQFKFELAGNTLKPLRYEPNQFVLVPVDGIQLKVTHRKN